MKKSTLSLILICLVTSVIAQVDTIYSKKLQKIPCRIIEINENDFKYRPAGMEDGPMYVISRSTIVKYTLSNGFSEVIVPDELSIENEHGDIIKNRTAVKLHPFSIVNGQVSLAYEKVIKVGMNLDIEAGYSNSNINSEASLTGGSNGIFNSGAYIKPGVKFFLGQDYSVKGLKYAHPLKGRYIKLDVALSYLNYQNLQRYDYSVSNPTFTTPARVVTSDMNIVSYGGFVNYGRQFILGNILTLEYYVGVGFTGMSYSYSNPEILAVNNSQLYSYYYYYGPYYNRFIEGRNVVNFHGFMRSQVYGLSFTGGFRIGYIIPEKKPKRTSGQPLEKN